MKLLLGRAVYAALPDGGFIFFDLSQDSYLGLNSQDSECLLQVIAGASSAIKEELEFLEELMAENILTFDESIGKEFVFERQPNPSGLSSCVWRPFESTFLPEVKPSYYWIWRSLVCLWSINNKLKNRGLKVLIDEMELATAQENARPDRVLLARIKASLDVARLLFWKRTECLPNALALFFIAHSQGIKVKFKMGVQKYPFYAHSWIEFQNEVVNDHAEVRLRLAQIVCV